jgi:hypothetical protein
MISKTKNLIRVIKGIMLKKADEVDHQVNQGHQIENLKTIIIMIVIVIVIAIIITIKGIDLEKEIVIDDNIQ